MATKECARCGEQKDVSCFYKNERYADGYGSWCKKCHTENKREYRARRRKEDPEWHERIKAKHREYRRKHGYTASPDPKKVAARAVVGNAVRDGKMVPAEECEECGHNFTTNRREAHHPDYDKPLEVEWLCSLCHGKRHRMTEEAA